MHNANEIQKKADDTRPSLQLSQLVRFFIFSFVTPGVVLLAAWDATWVMGWILVLMIGVPAVVTRLIILRKNPDLLFERGNYRTQSGVKSWDMVLASIVGLFGPLLTWLIAGLDHKFGWSEIPMSLQWWSMVLLFLSMLFSNWALIVNKYFSAVVRIQIDRGHTVITSGPYRLVRHPGYAGGVLGNLAMPLMLGSLLALIPAVLTVIILLIRTAKEDQTLIEELPGYSEYAQVTRYRIIPGIW
jgi:protein-S-isoprenylcysteine O-methyltransferase Ste14